MKFFASCGKGLEYLLADELSALGCTRATAALAGVNVEGSLADAQRAVLWSRLASRVLWPLAEYDCPDEHALYAGAAAIAWHEHLDPTMTLAVDAHVSGGAITHARYAALRIKDAVVDVLRERTGTRPDVDVEAPDLRLNLVVRKGRAIVSVDLGGGPLHRRGWRRAQGEAPLKENLAAAVLLRGGWPQLHREGGMLLDPMCGSGTLLIEGALMAADVAPGLMRHDDRQPSRWLGFNAVDWQAQVADAQVRERAGRGRLQRVFLGSDSDPHAIRAARENATAAGVRDVIHFDERDILHLRAPHAVTTPSQRAEMGGEGADRIPGNEPPTAGRADGAPAKEATTSGDGGPAASDRQASGVAVQAATPRGLVVCNPPYDARLAADAGLYRDLGRALQEAVPGWRASLLCGDAALARATGLRAAKRYQVFNGALECVLVVCDPIAAPRQVPAPVATVAADAAVHSQPLPSAALSEGAQMVANRLRKNLRTSKAWRAREGITCYRAYDADLPEYSAAVDVYQAEADGEAWLHVQEYAAPAEIPEETTRRRLGELVDAVREVFVVPGDRIALKTRERGKGGSKYASGGGRFAPRGDFLVVREGAARLRVNLFDHLDTGLFLDHRPLRLRLGAEADDTRFLNLFGYTGAATVHAALGCARQTTTVDLSATYLQWCADNLQENGIGGPRHRLVQADAMAWLEVETAQYDLIFCDPPTFSNSARAADFDLQREHVRLLEAATARLAPGGVLYFSNNARRFRLDGAAVSAFAEWQDISAKTLDPDFARNPRIHQAWRLQARPQA